MVVGIGITLEKEIGTLELDIGTNFEGGHNGGGKREDIGDDGTTKGMTQWERET